VNCKRKREWIIDCEKGVCVVEVLWKKKGEAGASSAEGGEKERKNGTGGCVSYS